MRSLGIAALLYATTVSSSPQDLYGYGHRSPGMAGLGVASAKHYDAVYINPAGISKERRLYFGFSTARFGLRLNGSLRDVDKPHSVTFGGTTPLRFRGWLKDRINLGMATHVPLAALNRARAPLPGEPWFTLLENRSYLIAFLPGVSMKVTDRLSLGASMMLLATLKGRLFITTDAAGRLTSQSRQNLIASLVPLAGARYRLDDRWNLGLVFRGETKTRYDLVIDSELGEQIPLALPRILVAGTAQYVPMTVAIEGEFQVSDNVSLSGQLAWMNWSAFPFPTENGTEGTPAQEPPGFSDTIVPRIGIEYHLVTSPEHQFTLRSGYTFIQTPAREMTGEQSFLDNHRQVISGGVSFENLKGFPFSLHGWGQFHYLHKRSHEKEADGSVLRTSGTVVAGGIAMGLSY